MVKPVIDALTATVPQLGQSAAEFDANTNDFLPQLVPLQDQINLAIDWTEDQVAAVDANAAAALISEAEAENAAFDADVSAGAAADSATEAGEKVALAVSAGAAAAGADLHVPNAAYTASNPASAAVSNENGQTYRCVVSHSGVSTDPSADATNWVLISAGNLATQLEAEAGTNNTELMTPLRTAQAIDALASGGGGLVPIGTMQTVAPVAAMDILLSGEYEEYVLKFWEIFPTTPGSDLLCRVSDDAGATFITSSWYLYAGQEQGSNGATQTGIFSGSGNSHIPLAADVLNSYGGSTGQIRIVRPHTTSAGTPIFCDAISAESYQLHSAQKVSAMFTNTLDIDAIRLYFSAGNIYGKYQLYGVATA